MAGKAAVKAVQASRKKDTEQFPAAVGPLSIIYRAPGDLVPYVKNARTHSDAQVAQIRASINEFGFTNPILVDEHDGLIAGHGRVLASQLAPALASVPTIVLAGLTGAQKRALLLADNKLALNAGWDFDVLRLELGELTAAGYNLDLTGFGAGELIDIFSVKAGFKDPDDAPALEDVHVSAMGDVWLLGAHRLTCGDSCESADVSRVLAGAKPHLMVTDPPYGVNYDAAWRRRAGLNGPTAAHGVVQNDDRADWRIAWQHFPGSVAYVWHGGLHSSTVEQSLLAAKFNIRSPIIWVKTRPVIGRGDYHWQHEPAFYAVEEGEDDRWNQDHEEASYAVMNGLPGQFVGGRKQSTVWMIEHLKSDTGHSTQKPVECMKRPILNNSKPGDDVYEPFSGSGTTLIAAEMTGRRLLAIELHPGYVDVAVRRWAAFTGKEATLEGDGRTFEQVREARRQEKGGKNGK